jgi:hypothetical protein
MWNVPCPLDGKVVPLRLPFQRVAELVLSSTSWHRTQSRLASLNDNMI